MTDKYLAVFDWNSTLFDDFSATHEATNACLEFFNIAPISKDDLQSKFTFPLIHFYEKAGVKIDDYLQNTTQLAHIFHTKYDALKQQCGLMAGAIEALDFCKAQNMHCLILSNYNQRPLEEDVKHLGVAEYFETISGNQDPEAITSGTNKLERLEAYMTAHNFVAEQTFIIGDSHEEPELARKLNILGVSIAGGLLSPARLAHYKKDYIIEDLSELPSILKREWGLPESSQNVKT